MSRRLLPWPSRIGLLVRGRGGAFAILAGVVAVLVLMDVRSLALFAITVGIPLALTSDALGIRSGAAVLWIQKPVVPLRFFAARLLERTVAGVALVTVTSALLRIGLESAGSAADEAAAVDLVQFLAMQPLLALVIVVMAFSSSVWLPRTGRLLTAVLLGSTFLLEVSTALAAPDSASGWIPWIRLLLVPWVSRVGIGAGNVVPDSVMGVLVWSLLYAVAWTCIGALGVRRALAGGKLARASRD